MSARLPGDQATVTISVAVEPTVAFEVFTQETDLWWKRGIKYRIAGRRPGTLQFEPVPGGRLFETYETEAGPQLTEMGRVLVWDPPKRLMFVWRNSNFTSDEQTEVEVTFEPTSSGTQVVLQHRGWATLRGDHPARHGLAGAEFSRMIGLWWGELLGGFREYAATKTNP